MECTIDVYSLLYLEHSLETSDISNSFTFVNHSNEIVEV